VVGLLTPILVTEHHEGKESALYCALRQNPVRLDSSQLLFSSPNGIGSMLRVATKNANGRFQELRSHGLHHPAPSSNCDEMVTACYR